MKNIVYRTKVHTRAEFIIRIMDVAVQFKSSPAELEEQYVRSARVQTNVLKKKAHLKKMYYNI